MSCRVWPRLAAVFSWPCAKNSPRRSTSTRLSVPPCTLHAVHCRRPGQHGGELLAQDLHRHVVYLHVVVVAAEREFRRLGAGGVLEAHVDDVVVARGHRREHAFDGAVVAVDVGHEPNRCAHLHRDRVVSARTRIEPVIYTSCRVRSRVRWCGGGMLQMYTQAAELMCSSLKIDVKSFRTMQHVIQASKLHRAQSI